MAGEAEQVLVTAAVGEDIPQDWAVNRVEIRMTESDQGRISVVQS